MKKILTVFMLLVLAISLPVYGQNASYLSGVLERGKTGIIDTFTGWLEVPSQTQQGYQSGIGEEGQNHAVGAIVGVFRGIVEGVGKTAKGVYEVATCLVPNQKNEGIADEDLILDVYALNMYAP